jgi:hypothetical protein
MTNTAYNSYDAPFSCFLLPPTSGSECLSQRFVFKQPVVTGLELFIVACSF